MIKMISKRLNLISMKYTKGMISIAKNQNGVNFDNFRFSNRFTTIHMLVSLLPSNHNQVEECMQTLTREFSQTFAERHLLSHLQFYTGSLNEAITKSSFDPDFVRVI